MKQERMSAKDYLRSGVPAPRQSRKDPDGFGLRLLAPPSVNECFRDPTPKERARGVRHRIRTKVYNEWRDTADYWLASQRVPLVGSPVRVTIRVGKCNQARDIDNFAKPILDVLVRFGAITNDNLKNVHEVRLLRAFGDISEGVVAVQLEAIS